MHWVPKLELGNQQITLFDKSLTSLPFIIFMSFMVIKTSYKHCISTRKYRVYQLGLYGFLGAIEKTINIELNFCGLPNSEPVLRVRMEQKQPHLAKAEFLV